MSENGEVLGEAGRAKTDPQCGRERREKGWVKF